MSERNTAASELNAAQKTLSHAVAPLTAWFAENRADLPWRREPSPYHVWLSEIMLQQTRIRAALPYYERFLQAAPDIAALASLPDDALMKLWEGLGYYSRAKNLKKAAQTVTEQYGGELPHTAEELRKLPGIGSYTAGAIASIAYGEPEPAVDGNVLRVLARLTEMTADVLDPATKAAAEAVLRTVYPRGKKAALLTEGLMELGEVVCLPNAEPVCETCPLAALCMAHVHGKQNDFPVRAAQKARKTEKRTVLLLAYDGRYALCKRPDSGLLAGLWEFPGFAGQTKKARDAFFAAHGVAPVPCRKVAALRHVFTHVTWEMAAYRADCKT
ncbi:MAG: A/G-specific adenine glycosylase, partial [Clostridia bacterium]|nr:A/G-specific adenine glycosylase [Clostridia bacterium]